MNNPLLSIIIPVYNVEQYIEESLNSLLAQSFTNFEAILVDDGSTDNSGDICDRYAKKDKRFKVIHKSNGGVSSARNVALEICKGKYITMLDPDDSIATDSYDNIYYMEQHPDIDILQYPYVYCDEGGKQEVLLLKSKVIIGKEAIALHWWEGNILHFANLNKIFKHSIFEKLRYREGHLSEDTFLIPDFIYQADKIYISEIGRYYYKIRKGSLSSSYDFNKHIDLYEANLRIYKILITFPSSKPIRVKAFIRIIRRLISAQNSDPHAKIDSYLNELRIYVPSLTDIIANKDYKLTIWILLIKTLTISTFTKLYCSYLFKKTK